MNVVNVIGFLVNLVTTNLSIILPKAHTDGANILKNTQLAILISTIKYAI